MKDEKHKYCQILLIVILNGLLLYIAALFTSGIYKGCETDFQDSIWKLLHTRKLHLLVY